MHWFGLENKVSVDKTRSRDLTLSHRIKVDANIFIAVNKNNPTLSKTPFVKLLNTKKLVLLFVYSLQISATPISSQYNDPNRWSSLSLASSIKQPEEAKIRALQPNRCENRPHSNIS
jgi:hypothetical protein